MKNKAIALTKRGFQALGLELRRYQAPRELSPQEKFDAIRSQRDAYRLATESDENSFIRYCFAHAASSNAQLMQDLFALYELKGKQNGYFVEFGATDGVSLSNTLLLERSHGWRGVLAEPARSWHAALRQNRSADICTDCVWNASGETLGFNETASTELSTIETFSDSDRHVQHRENGKRYEVVTISLNDLLARHAAPQTIDYLSVDTEGSEYEILNAFDFATYDVRVLTVEHNYTANRERIFDLLRKNGFQRKFENLSQWDDWYVKATV